MDIRDMKGLNLQTPIGIVGKTQYSADETKFLQDLKVLFESPRGMMLGNPDFGSDLYQYLFLPATNGTANLIKTEINRCIREYYSGLQVVFVDVTFIDKFVKLNIKLVRTNSNQTYDIEYTTMRGGV